MQRLLADDVMRKRWRLKVEAKEYAPYEASDEISKATEKMNNHLFELFEL